MKCLECPASWEVGGMTDCGYECDSYGCLILGVGLLDDNCHRSRTEVERRLQELKDYEDGKIDRPQWVANRFMREMDESCAFSGSLGYSLPAFPPLRMRKGVYNSLYSSMGLTDNAKMHYRNGYEDAKAGKPMDLEQFERKRENCEEVLLFADYEEE